jgi:hypothetical protein
MYTTYHHRIHASAIALAVLAISSAAVADSMSNDAREASRETAIRITYASAPDPRTSNSEVSAGPATATLTGTFEEESNKVPAERSTLGVSGRNRGGNRFEDEAEYAAVAYTSGTSIYGEAFDHASVPVPVTWILAKKCGWLCMRVRF